MTEWIKDMLGINRYIVETYFCNGRHSTTGMFSKRTALQMLADRKRRWWYAENSIRKVPSRDAKEESK